MRRARIVQVGLLVAMAAASVGSNPSLAIVHGPSLFGAELDSAPIPVEQDASGDSATSSDPPGSVQGPAPHELDFASKGEGPKVDPTAAPLELSPKLEVEPIIPAPTSARPPSVSEDHGQPANSNDPTMAPAPCLACADDLRESPSDSQAALAPNRVASPETSEETLRAANMAAPVERANSPFAIATIAAAVILLCLYHRLRSARVLEHPIRCAILEEVQRKPGVLPSEIAARQGVTLNAILYHVRTLSREGFVIVRRVGAARLLFAAGADARERELAASARSPVARAIVDSATRGHAITVTQAQRLCGATETPVRRQLAKLVRCGVLLETRKGRASVFVAPRTFVPAP